jgi:hypothetical protein
VRRTIHRSRGIAATFCLAAATSLLTACETPLDRAYGLSQRAHVAQSTENPDAGIDDVETRRPDGTSTDAAISRFRRGEIAEQEAQRESVINVDIGG